MDHFRAGFGKASFEMNTERYHGMFLLSTAQGTPVAVLRSKTANPGCWCLIKGYSSLYFHSYKEVQEYCNSHNLKPFKGGRIKCKH